MHPICKLTVLVDKTSKSTQLSGQPWSPHWFLFSFLISSFMLDFFPWEFENHASSISKLLLGKWRQKSHRSVIWTRIKKHSLKSAVSRWLRIIRGAWPRDGMNTFLGYFDKSEFRIGRYEEQADSSGLRHMTIYGKTLHFNLLNIHDI